MGYSSRDINKESFLRKALAYDSKAKFETKPKETYYALGELITNGFSEDTESDDKIFIELRKTESEYKNPRSSWSEIIAGKCVFSKARSSKTSEMETIFFALRDKWKEETEFSPTIAKITANKYYLEIIGLGERALPFIFRELEKRPGHWFVALTAILRNDPVPVEIKGNMRKMADIWLDYGRKHGWI